jgi:hypothetical protein
MNAEILYKVIPNDGTNPLNAEVCFSGTLAECKARLRKIRETYLDYGYYVGSDMYPSELFFGASFPSSNLRIEYLITHITL